MHLSFILCVSLCLMKEIFPVYFGAKYEAALEMLVWEFISRLEELLPVPDFTQVTLPLNLTLQCIITQLSCPSAAL